MSVWDRSDPTSRPEKEAVLPGNGAGVTSLAFSADGETLAVGGKDGTIRFWDCASMPIDRGEGGVGNIAFNPNSMILASVWPANVIRISDLSEPGSRSRLARIPNQSPYPNQLYPSISNPQFMAFLAERRLLLMQGPNVLIMSIGASSRSEDLDLFQCSVPVPPLGGPFFGEYAVFGISATANRLRLATGAKRVVQLWDLADLENFPSAPNLETATSLPEALGHLLVDPPIFTIRPADRFVDQSHSSEITGLSLSTDGGTLAVTLGSRTTQLWDLRRRNEAELMAEPAY